MAPEDNSRTARVRRIALPLVLVGATILFGAVASRHYPIHRWLFWRYAGYWLLSALFATSSLSVGHLAVKRVLGRPLPFLEQLVTSFAVGVYIFAVGVFVAGLFGLYGPIFFGVFPLALGALGARPLARYIGRYARHLRHARKSARPLPLWVFPVLAFGLIGCGMVYLAILTPENASYDSRWQHMGLAEHYAAQGAVRRFPEGWLIGTYPQLTAWLYTWAYQLPFSQLFDRVELSAHIEFVVFLWTLAGVSALARRLVPRARVPHAWVTRFLFPGIFLYDSSLSVGADHIAAVFAAPIFLLLIRAWASLPVRYCVLLAWMLSGAILTKYSAAMLLIALPVLAVALRSAMLGITTLTRKGNTPSGAWYKGPIAAIAAGLVLTSPHWLKNFAWYGDPFYPVLYKHLAVHPWTVDSPNRFEFGYKGAHWVPKPGRAGWLDSLKVLFTFSFVPNDWVRFHGKVPVFGSLFTLSLACLPFLGKRPRLWALFASVHLGIFIWYWTHHQDRFLQAAMPWMAAGTAATFALIWQVGRSARVALGALVGLQIVWGGDVYFIPGHAMSKLPQISVMELFSEGYKRNYQKRFHVFSPFSDIGLALPRGARVLVHDMHLRVGLGAAAVSDASAHQGGISYGRLKSAREVYDLLSGLGVTHIVRDYTKSTGVDTLAGDLRFFEFISRHTKEVKRASLLSLLAMPAAPPPAEPGSDVVAILDCSRGYHTGLYHLSALTGPVFGPRRNVRPRPFDKATRGEQDDARLIEAAAFLVVNPACHKTAESLSTASFTMVATRKPYKLWVRTADAKGATSALP